MLGMMMMMMLGEQLDCCIPKRSTRGEGLESFCGSGLWWPKPCHGLAVAAFAFDVSVMEKTRFLKALAMQGRVTPRDGAAVQRCLLKAPWRKFKLYLKEEHPIWVSESPARTELHRSMDNAFLHVIKPLFWYFTSNILICPIVPEFPLRKELLAPHLNTG